MQPLPTIKAPTIAPYQPPAPFDVKPKPPGAFTLNAPAPAPVGSFTGTAPTPKPFGSFESATPTAAFVAPQPGAMSQAGQFRLNQSLKALQAGAAARGTLLTGPLQARLVEHAGDAASQEYDNDYRRALATYETNRGTDAQNFGQRATTYGANRETAVFNADQDQDAYSNLLTGYATNRDTAAQNAAQSRATFDDALTGFRANADTTLASNAQDLAAATAGYDRNADTARTLYEDAAGDAMRRTNVENVNNAGVYQTQMLDYARQQEEARQQQELQLQQQAAMERARLENEALQRAGAARQNAATNAVPLARPVAARVSTGRRGGVAG
jgi:hypothetical protein